jgi:hypothetical protein
MAQFEISNLFSVKGLAAVITGGGSGKTGNTPFFCENDYYLL